MKFKYIEDVAAIPVLDTPVLILPILQDHRRHRCETQISFIYAYDLEGDKEYIINSKHCDYPQTKNLNLLREKFIGKVYTFTKSYISKIFPNSIDCNVLYWCQYNSPMEIEFNSEIKLYHQWYHNISNINNIIPLMCWLIYLRNLRVQCASIINYQEPTGVDFYNHALYLFSQIEDNGLTIDPDISKQFINKSVSKLFTQYNIYTSTGRPSNHFNSINFAALNKSTGIRSMIIPSGAENLLVEYDYDSMHLRLASDLISFDLPQENLHEYFGRFYFNTPVLGAENYEISKNLTWYLLYGNISSQYLNIPFFKRVSDYKNSLWNTFNRNGFVEMPISKRKIYKENFDTMSKNILFNYLLQGYETEFNCVMLNKILKYLYKKKSKIVLYTYDSFLFDINKEDGKQIIFDLKDLLSTQKMTVKIHYGTNYQSMKKLIL